MRRIIFCLILLLNVNVGTAQYCDSAVFIRVLKKDAVDESSFKTFSINKLDTFNSLPLNCSAVAIEPCSIPLNNASAFSVFYKNQFLSTDFLAIPGDSITIELYSDTVILSNSKNQIISLRQYVNETNELLSSYRNKVEGLLSQVLTKKSVSIAGRAGFYYVKRNGAKKSEYESTKAATISVLKNLWSAEERLLDSLIIIGRISPEFAQFVRISGKCKNVIILNHLSKNFEGYSKLSDFEEFSFFDENLVFSYNGVYRGILSFTVINDLILKGMTIEFSNDYSGPDYRAAYDSAELYLGGTNLDYVRYSCLLKIKEQFSRFDFLQYSRKFFDQVHDPNILNYLKQNVVYDINVTDINDLLTNFENNELYLASLLNKNKLKYVDFWASWCKPCREAMPASQKLREEYQDREIEFIYISIDELKPSWMVAASTEGLVDYPLSFLLLNAREANIIKKYEIFSIPRYLLFDRSGKLIYRNAPAPSDPRLKQIIDNLLSDH